MWRLQSFATPEVCLFEPIYGDEEKLMSIIIRYLLRAKGDPPFASRDDGQVVVDSESLHLHNIGQVCLDNLRDVLLRYQIGLVGKSLP